MTDQQNSSQGRVFQVVNAPIGVYAAAGFGSEKIGELPVGAEIEVEEGSRSRVEGVIWWRHSQGWSPQRSITRDQIYLVRVNRKYFRVIDGPLSVRPEPTTLSQRLGELALGTVIEVEPDSRTEANNFVWWKHPAGWSAERSLDGGRVFLETFNPKGSITPEPEPETEPQPEEKQEKEEQQAPETPKVRYMRVTNGPLSVRIETSSSSTRIGTINTGEELEVDPASRTEANGFVWWKHATGWSAERSLDGKSVFMTAIESLTKAPIITITPKPSDPITGEFKPEPIFVRLPVDIKQVQWVQYFGNTQYAYNIRKEGKTWYNYCQGLHGGIDFGNSLPGIPIYAGVEGVVVKLERNSSSYSPNFLMVRAGTVNQFLVVYGHMAAPNHFNPGDRITPDMILGRIDSGGQNHLHLEVRYAETQIINPLLVMPEALRDLILKRWSNYSSHFYRDATWTKWQDPFDQPTLKLCGPSTIDIIGPHGRR